MFMCLLFKNHFVTETEKFKVYYVYCCLNRSGNCSGSAMIVMTGMIIADHFLGMLCKLTKNQKKVVVENKNHSFTLQVFFFSFTAQAIKVQCWLCHVYQTPEQVEKKLFKREGASVEDATSPWRSEKTWPLNRWSWLRFPS